MQNRIKAFYQQNLAKYLYKENSDIFSSRLWDIFPIEAAIFTLTMYGKCNTEAYLHNYKDVAHSGISAIEHFVRHGIFEKRIMPILEDKPDMVKAGLVEFLYGTPLFIGWTITNMCNYTCSYCFGPEKLDKSKFSSLGQLMTAIDNIEKAKRTSYSFTFTGGGAHNPSSSD